jgi:hypothetical protein
MRKFLAISLAAVGPVLLATTVLVAASGGGGGDGGDGAARRHGPPASAPATTSVPPITSRTAAPAAVVPAEPVGVSRGPVARPRDPSGEETPDVGAPASPEDATSSVFDAWLHGDDALLRELATASVADFLGARTPHDPDGWTGPTCEGAAGSSYCTWSQPGFELVFRMGNEDVALGRSHAVRSAFFWVPAGGVAVWPFTTMDQATAAQTGADQGHQAWLLDPAAVATHYAQAELGWPDAQVQPVPLQDATYDVTDPASGVHAGVTLTQPQRRGPQGIWAVSSAGSA